MIPRILYELGKVGYEGIIMEDHVLKMDYDSDYGHRARSHAARRQGAPAPGAYRATAGPARRPK